MTFHTNPSISPTFLGLDVEDRRIAAELVQRLNEKIGRNQLRRKYYETHNTLKDMGISIPPQLTKVEVALGWPAKAIDTMSLRTILEGFDVGSGSTVLQAMLAELWEANNLAFEAPAAQTSTLTHGCAFAFVARGDGPGEPEVIISVKSAEDASAIWDSRKRQVSAALSVDARDDDTGAPTLMHLFLPERDGAPGRVLRMDRNTWGAFEAVVVSIYAGRVPVEPMTYRASLNRPFGRSRISRAVMYLTDASVRTMLRTEVGAEFYNAPQRYALGAEEDAFVDGNNNPVPAWTVMLGRLLTLSRDENGDLPSVGQFSQQTMQPNIEQFRTLAQAFSAETSISVDKLGIVQDNPSSAEAILANNEELGIGIEHWERTALGPAWRRVMQLAAGMVDGSELLEEEARTISAQWGSWSAPSEASQAQASLARVQAIPRLAETTVELKRMGYTREEITTIQGEWARSSSRSNLQGLLANAAGRNQGTEPTGDPNANATKAKADAMGVLIRAGVEPDDAANRVGLAGIEFTGAVPVSLRIPQEDAAVLEDA